MDLNVRKHLEFLGLPVKDKVTGFRGIVTSIGFDLYGCIQAIVTPEVDKNGDKKDSRWFDINRLEVKSERPVMECPKYFFKESCEEDYKDLGLLHGPAEKPSNSRY